jgi:hypothetical protein
MTPPSLPAPVRALNWGGHQLRRIGVPLIRLDESSLLDAARKKTGLSDFGGDGFREGLRKLLDSLEREGRLSLLGCIIARKSIVDLLVNRLEMTDVHRQHPEIARGRIQRPIFVIGMPRTGTSILHELLAQDPANRTPLSWEVAKPCPPPERETYETDPRIAKVDAQLAQTDWLIPGFKKIHPMGARLPQECVAITAHDFASMLFSTTNHVPGYTEWLHNQADLAPVYASHRRMLQLLQWHCPAERWVLKSPGHLWSIDALIKEYPDARLVQTHRDPLKIISSLMSLSLTLRSMASEQVEPGALVREWSGYVSLALERSVTARENGTVKADQVVDVQFDDLLADTFGTIRKIYDQFGLEYTAEAESRMRRFLAENPSDKHGKHTYRFVDTGLDVDEERRKVQRYQEFFGVRSEEKT